MSVQKQKVTLLRERLQLTWIFLIRSVKNNEVKISSLEEEKVQLNPSKPDKVFFAWFVDTAGVFLVIAAAMIMLFTLTGIPLSNLSQFLSHKSSIGFVLLFFLVFYLIYFSILIWVQVLGKLC